MAVTPLIATSGVRVLQRDLKAMVPGAQVEVRQVVKGALAPMLQVAKAQAPGTGQTIGERWRASMRGANGALTNRHPGALPWEFGGTIAPRGAPIALQPAAHMIWGPGGAIEQAKGDTERLLHAGFERLARRHGFTGS